MGMCEVHVTHGVEETRIYLFNGVEEVFPQSAPPPSRIAISPLWRLLGGLCITAPGTGSENPPMTLN